MTLKPAASNDKTKINLLLKTFYVVFVSRYLFAIVYTAEIKQKTDMVSYFRLEVYLKILFGYVIVCINLFMEIFNTDIHFQCRSVRRK